MDEETKIKMDRKHLTLGLVLLFLVACAQVAAGFDTPKSSAGSRYWIGVQDARTGIRFAVPCFWEVNIPAGDQDPSGLGAFPIRNYDDAFVTAHPKEAGFWESGALKIDIGYVRPATFGLAPGASLSDVAHALVGGEQSEFQVAGTGYVTVNGQPALEVATRSETDPRSIGRFYLLALAPDLYVTFSAAPAGAFEHPDVQGVLYSLALSAEVSVHVPDVAPSAPPASVHASCQEASAP
jgi:hypothetical protein